MPICRRCHLLYTRSRSASPSKDASAPKTQTPASDNNAIAQDSATAAAAAAAETKCRYHPDMFVCRPHAADHYAFEINDKFMKDLQGWPAKFWDCCGAETADAPGCVLAEEHVPAYE